MQCAEKSAEEFEKLFEGDLRRYVLNVPRYITQPNNCVVRAQRHDGQPLTDLRQSQVGDFNCCHKMLSLTGTIADLSNWPDHLFFSYLRISELAHLF